jgi:hypothetical protein
MEEPLKKCSLKGKEHAREKTPPRGGGQNASNAARCPTVPENES